MAFLSRREETTQSGANPEKKPWYKRSLFRNGLALTLSAGLFGTLVLPAYAALPEGQDTYYASDVSVQSLMVDSNVINESLDVQTFGVTTSGQIAEIDSSQKAEAARVAAEEKAKAAAATTTTTIPSSPSGSTPDRTNASCASLAMNDTSSFVGAAIAQLGCYQDCTALVENALHAIGIPIGDVAPMGFGGVGTVFTDPSQVQAGDIMMRNGHVSIYLGDGKAIHGGWTDGSTVIAGGSISNPSNYVQFVRL